MRGRDARERCAGEMRGRDAVAKPIVEKRIVEKKRG
jgi:hypothetical protein